jgi:F0F1-type ATP synthase membrane subunit b/b'
MSSFTFIFYINKKDKIMDLKFFTVETLVIQTIILFIVLWVLNKYLFKPYLQYLDEFE